MARLLVAALFAVAAAFSSTAAARDVPAAVTDIRAEQLPAEARETLALIKRGGPFPYRKDGAVFGNRERLLPPQPPGYYTEYTVKTPRQHDRGPRRIVAGRGSRDPATSGEYYYTDDHYNSFRRIRE